MLIENEHVRKSKLTAFYTAFLGFTLSSNIIYVFSVGSTYFTIAEVYSVALFIYLILARKVDWANVLNIMGLAFKLFCTAIAFTGVCAFITFLNISLMYRFMVGVISFCICLTTMVDVIVLFDYRISFAKGCIFGIVINGLICIIQYIFYQSNKPFTILYDLFQQDSFHLNIYNFCAQGLFLEPSHMNQYLATIVPIVIGFMGLKTFKNKLYLAVVLMCCALSTSGTAAVVLVGFSLFIMIKKPFRRYVNRDGFILMYCMAMIAAIVVVFFSDSSALTTISDNVGKYIKLAAEGSNIGDSSNAERVQSMQVALKLIPQNPLGCGWNMVHTLLQQRTNLGTASAYSDMLEMVLEIGVLGVGLYIISVFRSISACLRLKNQEAAGVATALICVLIMETLVDYAINPCIMSVLALGMCFRRKYYDGCKIGEGE